VIGGGHEAEEGPALSLTAAVLPRVACRGRHLETGSLPGPEAGAEAWQRATGVAEADRPKLLLLADPFTLDVPSLLPGLDAAFPGAPKFGGLASGGGAPGEHRLVLGDEVHREGAVLVALSGDLEVETVIAQGCRAIGPPLHVARCRGGLLQSLEEGPPLRVLSALYEELEPRDRELVRHSLFLGLEMAPGPDGEPGELLVRNLLGADEETGALAVGAWLRPGQPVRFVLRDAHSAEQDLRRLLSARRGAGAPAGALLFSCTGRGAGLFGHEDHDTGMFQERFGATALGGFFCNGEIGPVGGTTFLHGYTSAFALFREGGGAPRPQTG
jgi:small ligand-binding sensory domain FIST